MQEGCKRRRKHQCFLQPDSTTNFTAITTTTTTTTTSNKKKKKKKMNPNPSPCCANDNGKESSSKLLKSREVYPNHPRPTPEECRSVRDNLLNFHGFPQEFLKYCRRISSLPDPEALLKEVEVGKENESVLDGLISILLSQNTTQANSTRAFATLKSTFPSWEDVVSADSKFVESAIKCGGLAVTKAACIKNLLNGLIERKGKLCLEYLREMAVDEIKTELCSFKGIGPKTVACLLMFHLQHDDFPVDTHVFRITKAMGWIPASSDKEKAYLHLNKRIPNELKFDLNCLLVTHGKLCRSCSKKGNDNESQPSSAYPCPLSNCTLKSESSIEKNMSGPISLGFGPPGITIRGKSIGMR